MNRMQFLAELSQYLTFLSPEEKAKVIAYYTKMFDSAGENGEDALIIELGTPMLIAIDLKRRKEAGQPLPEETLFRGSESMNAYCVETDTYESICKQESCEDDENSVDEEKPVTAHEKKGVKNVFAVIGAAILSIVLAAVFAAVAACGVFLLIAMSYLLLTGLKSLYYIADALLLFAGGLICGGFGIFIVWFAVWSAVSLISRLFRSALGRKNNGVECDT